MKQPVPKKERLRWIKREKISGEKAGAFPKIFFHPKTYKSQVTY
ncbi:hypothetical protein MmTuc01_1241 [Methanosarcina mazei Tuc01]|jgi:hypothetical protein|uniref:Uncharacterized protein n=1 Tax=Methanosarcina mazei Tuc01 TaxID=1236903 RepID=M1Q8V4_METMZ|nr:hypothetical protein MmTuc01_1241 [Methanosarcina mazei Tuc01]